jgi:hypothetical protein
MVTANVKGGWLCARGRHGRQSDAHTIYTNVYLVLARDPINDMSPRAAKVRQLHRAAGAGEGR